MIFKDLREKLRRYAALTTGDFERIFRNFKVPSLPDIVIKLISLLRDPEVSPPQVASLLSYDPGLASRILQMVNSAHIGLAKPVSNLSQAVNILGLKQIETLVISYGVTRIIKDPCRENFDLAAFWTDSLLRALFAHEMGKASGREDEAFLGALLQDIALPVLLTEWFEAYKKAYLEAQKNQIRLSEAESRILKWHHAQAGAWLAKKWHLSDIIICAIGLHTSSPQELKTLPLQDEIFFIVAFSGAIPSVLEREPSWEPWLAFVREGFFSSQKALEALRKAREHLLETAKNFGLKVREPQELPNL